LFQAILPIKLIVNRNHRGKDLKAPELVASKYEYAETITWSVAQISGCAHAPKNHMASTFPSRCIYVHSASSLVPSFSLPNTSLHLSPSQMHEDRKKSARQ